MWLHKNNSFIIKIPFPKLLELDLKLKIPYPTHIKKLVKVCKEQLEQQQKVESILNIKEYDVIFIGFPIWFETYPLLLNDFFSKITKNDWKDKKVYAFCTFGQSVIKIVDLKKQFKEVINIVSKLEVINEQMGNVSSITDEWVNSIKDLI